MLKNRRVASCSVLLLTFAALLPNLGSAQRIKERVVEHAPYKDPPVEILAVKVQGVAIKMKHKFVGDSDWLKGMTVAIKNVSDRPIAYVSVLVGAPYEKNGERILAVTRLLYGAMPLLPGQAASTSSAARKPLPPGETAEVVLTEFQRDELYSLLQEDNASTDIRNLSIRVYDVFFEGDSDTMWKAGRIYRRDPSDPLRWVAIEPRPSSNRITHKPGFVSLRFETSSSALDDPEPIPDNFGL